MAYARSTEYPCQCKALANGRCKLHGGLSTGPKTVDGKQRVGLAVKHRLKNGQLEKLKTGYKAWLEDRGRLMLSNLMKERHKRFKSLQRDL